MDSKEPLRFIDEVPEELVDYVVRPEPFVYYTDDARRVVALAQQEARRLNHNYIGSEHLMLGLIQIDSTSEVFTRSGISLASARNVLEDIIGSERVQNRGRIPFTPSAQRVLDRADIMRRSDRVMVLTPDHLLRALLADHNTAFALLDVLTAGEGLQVEESAA